MTLICRNLILRCYSASWLSSLWLLDVLRWELWKLLIITIGWWLSWNRIALSSWLLLTISRFITCWLDLLNPCAAASWMWLSWIHISITLTLHQQILLCLTLNNTILSTLWMWHLCSALRNDIVVVNRVFLGDIVGNGDWRRCVYVLLCYVSHCKTLLITRSWSLIILVLIQNYLLMTWLSQNDIFLIAF